MLNAEEARARLTAIAAPDWHDQLDRRVGKLKRKLRPVAAPFAWQSVPLRTREEQVRRRQELSAAGAALDGLSDRDRAEVCHALHPGLGEVLARWWIDARSAPYTVGWARRSFRAPHAPSITADVRADRLYLAVQRMGPYQHDAVWLAGWAPHLDLLEGYGPRGFDHWMAGPLLASAIDLGGQQGERVLQELLDVGRGDHAIGVMGRYVIVGLLRASRPEGWTFVEQLLLAAQRQEGLRQVILEAVDEGHPVAFTRMIDLIVEHDLLRFAATVRAAGVWLGLSADVEDTPWVRTRVELLGSLRADRAAAERTAAGADPWDAYTALCAIAMDDVEQALGPAHQALAAADPNLRAMAVRFLSATALGSVMPSVQRSLDDPDLGVAMLAHSLITTTGDATGTPLFDQLERLATRLPEKVRNVEGLGVEVVPVALDRASVVSRMVFARGDRPLSMLVPWVPSMDPNTRTRLADAAGKEAALTADVRTVLLALVGDRSAGVRNAAVKAMAKHRLAPEDAPAMEALLTRKAGDLRRGVIGLLGAQPAPALVGSAQRLWAGDGPQRDAACELLAEADRTDPHIAQVAAGLMADGPTDTQRELLERVLGAGASGDPEDKVGPGLGLYDPARRTPARTPTRPARTAPLVSEAALRLVSALDDLVEAHRDTPFLLTNWQGTSEVLLADARYLPGPFGWGNRTAGDGEGRGLILPEVFHGWWADRPASLRGESDAIDAVQALVSLGGMVRDPARYGAQSVEDWWAVLHRKAIGGSVGELRHWVVVQHVLYWMLADHLVDGAVDRVAHECLDGLETVLSGVKPAQLEPLVIDPSETPIMRYRREEWRGAITMLAWSHLLNGVFAVAGDGFADETVARWLGLLRWIDEPIAGAARRPPDGSVVLRAHGAGLATDDDVYDLMLLSDGYWTKAWTRRRRDPFVQANPAAAVLVDRMRDRILEVERRRGELATPASAPALKLSSVEGADLAMELLSRLGRATLLRGHIWNNEGREAVYSHLLLVSHPSAGDTVETVAAAAKAHKVSEARLVDLGMYAPQWAQLIEGVLGWTGFADAVWWYHAHTKDDRWAVDAEVRETWAALSAERTPLSGEDLVAGAVDVDWYHRAKGELGAQRWAKVHKAAKMASGGAGHRRAQLFAEAMEGAVEESALLERIRSKRHQDSVRALGLVPLPSGDAARKAAALARYGVLQEFGRGSRQFGSQRQASEGTAVRIGVENLARTAGYPDPQRFTWAMEAAEAGDLADGPVVVTEGDVTVTLSVDVEGTPQIEVRRGEKALAAVPAALRKAPDIVELRNRKTALGRQASRVRASLEAAMVRGDQFVDQDFHGLQRHPVVAPMLDLLVFVDESGALLRRGDGGFVDRSGAPASPDGSVRIAHPVDLAAGDWVGWQEAVFSHEQRQPFRQVFRELYVLTEAERESGPLSRRWDGHQIQPRQSAALFGRRGWLTDREAGEVARVFHQHDLVARVGFLEGFGTAAEVELPTISGVSFTRRGSYLAEPLDQIPPIVFSEAMRDLDLVISVAHAGGVDPESTASTVEMRAALVRETARLLKLDNVREVGSHVVIEGVLGEYSVHLGSGTVHRRPGGAVCIIPVDAQRRGRIFLPFADDDPKTAEVLAKVLLLARDAAIKDPTILEQLRS